MQCSVTKDEANNFHIDWQLEGVTAHMIDWFWSNMEKGFILWHPEEHEEFYWPVSSYEIQKFIGAVHMPPQLWANGDRRDAYIRFDDPATLPADITAAIKYDHVVIPAPICIKSEDFDRAHYMEMEPLVYRLHQWTPTAYGVKGMSTCFREPLEKGEGWVPHAKAEIGNWEVFLPALYNLYKVVKNPRTNPFFDLTVERAGSGYRYADPAHYRAD